jgi:phosphoribosylamine---glycine ligase
MTINNILVVGGGGREHALVWALDRSANVGRICVAPGNAGTAELAENVDISAGDVNALVKFSLDKRVDLVVVGPEVPLAIGLVDALQQAKVKAFGPTQAAALLEASKAFSKAFMLEHGIPTAEYAEFENYDAAVRYLDEFNRPVVVKADGLAAGKGVIVCETVQEARNALKQIMLDERFGAAGSRVIIEERLEGPELSILAFSDGQHIAVMPPTRDHKRAYDGDEGPNTGGMGAFTPPPDVDSTLIEQIKAEVLQPAVTGLAAKGTPYIGVLYAGMMLTSDGPKALEFNCRFGDPETQVILPMLQSDLFEIMMACINGHLDKIDVRWREGACATVVMASQGYPGSYPKGALIEGIGQASALDEVTVFHAGTARGSNGGLVTAGGRVLAVSAVAPDLTKALNVAYTGVGKIVFDGAHFRKDIGSGA